MGNKFKALMDFMLGQPNGPASLGADGKLKQMPSAADVGAETNRNLLYNWYFPDPIDQRGGYVVPPDTPYYSDTELTAQAGIVSVYTKATKVNGTYGTITVSDNTCYVDWTKAVRGYAGIGYAVDRWKISSGAATYLLVEAYGVTIGNDAATGEGYVQYVLEPDYSKPLVGKTVTMSALVNGKLTKATGTVPNSTNWNIAYMMLGSGIDAFLAYNGSYLIIQIIMQPNKKITISGFKLELGSTQTFARQSADGSWVLNDPPPDKALELAKCQRYFRKIRASNILNSGYHTAAKELTFTYHSVLRAMRATPKLNIHYIPGATDTTNGIVITKGDTAQHWPSYITSATLSLVAKNDDVLIKAALPDEVAAPESKDYTILNGSGTYITADAEV